MKENLRMQFLAGLITESEYKAKLFENLSNKLVIYLYNNLPSATFLWYGATLIDSIVCKVSYMDDNISIQKYNNNAFSENESEIIRSYLNKLNVKYNQYFYIKGVSNYSNIEIIFTKNAPSFVPQDIKLNTKILDFFIKRDNPEQIEGDIVYGDVYDFGGAEGPIDGSQAVVVDLYLTPKQKKNPSKFIEADLSKYVELPPKNGINIFSAVAQINSPNNLSKTIKHALKPGGLLVIKDHLGAVQNLLKYLKEFKLLEFEYVDIEDEENITLSDQIFVVLKK
jgi:hypothetical protein